MQRALEPRLREFFEIARERHSVYLRRRAGQPWPWTENPILRDNKFCNVFRELDRTTVWFRQHVRDVLPPDQLLLATVVFRWFNRVGTGEAIFGATDMLDRRTPWEQFLQSGPNAGMLRDAIRRWSPTGPYVTGAYMIKSPTGMPKLEGICELIARFCGSTREFTWRGGDAGMYNASWRDVTRVCLERRGDVTLCDVWAWLRQHDHQGDFLSYEVVTDLRHTPLLSGAPDIDTWAHPGPGAMRGAARLQGGDAIRDSWGNVKRAPVAATQDVMREVLEASRQPEYWPQQMHDEIQMSGYYLEIPVVLGPWPRWEMREAEHWLCEYDKYCRVRRGEGRMKSVYRPHGVVR